MNHTTTGNTIAVARRRGVSGCQGHLESALRLGLPPMEGDRRNDKALAAIAHVTGRLRACAPGHGLGGAGGW